MKSLAIFLLAVPLSGAQTLEGWLVLSDGTRVEGPFSADRRRIHVRDVGTGLAEHLPVESLRRVRVWAVEDRRREGQDSEGDLAILGREFSAEIESADGTWRYSPLELALRQETADGVRKFSWDRSGRARYEGDSPPDVPYVVEAAFGPAAAAPAPGPRLSGRLDPAGGWRRVLAVRRESNLVAEGRILGGGAGFDFPWLYPGTWDLVLIGSASIDLWLEPEVVRGVGQAEETEALEEWVKSLAVREEDAAGGHEVRHALARGRAQAARCVVYESRWRLVHLADRPAETFDTERVVRLWFGRKSPSGWGLDRVVELDRSEASGGVPAALRKVRLDRRLSGVTIGRDRASRALDLLPGESR